MKKNELVAVMKADRSVKINRSQLAQFKKDGWNVARESPGTSGSKIEAGATVRWIDSNGDEQVGEFRKLDNNDDSIARVKVAGSKTLVSVALSELKEAS